MACTTESEYTKLKLTRRLCRAVAAACDAESDAAHIDAMPSEAPAATARTTLREAHMSACRCKNVLWSCSCSAMELENVCWSVHRGRARACARAHACVCAAQGLPNEPTRAGNGPPVPELCNHRTCASRARAPAMAHCSRNFFL